MHKIIEKLNKQKYIYITSIMDEVNVLVLNVYGTKLVKDTNPNIVDNEVLNEVLQGSSSIESNPNIGYKFIFERYIAYHVINESFDGNNQGKEYVGGNLIRNYTNSPYLDYVNTVSFGTQIETNYIHYQFNALDHIIDIIASGEPIIEKI